MTDEKKGYLGNQNAQKDPEHKAESFIHMRCLKNDKARWVLTAQSQGMKLTEWITSTLNKNTIL